MYGTRSFSVCPFLLKIVVLPAKTEKNIPEEIAFVKLFFNKMIKQKTYKMPPPSFPKNSSWKSRAVMK